MSFLVPFPFRFSFRSYVPNTFSPPFFVRPAAPELLATLQRATLENPESDSSWYSKYFANKADALLFLGEHEEQGPFVLAVVKETQRDPPHDALCLAQPYAQLRAMLFSKASVHRVTLPLEDDRATFTVIQIVALLAPAFSKNVKDVRSLVADAGLHARIAQLEEIQTARNFKFGILYSRAGQTSEEDMFSNEHGSAAFDAFLDTIGTRVQLAGFERFRGGLDSKQGKTGTQSVHTEFCGHEVMFHVSTLLPYNASDAQQLERKRHIGNDICTIVFQDGETDDFAPSFAPTAIHSHFLHVYCVVRPTRDHAGKVQYSVNVAVKDDVPPFGPLLRNPPVYSATDVRDFLLTKRTQRSTGKRGKGAKEEEGEGRGENDKEKEKERTRKRKRRERQRERGENDKEKEQ